MSTTSTDTPSTTWLRPAACTLALLGALCATGAQAKEEYARTYAVSGRAHVHVRADDGHVRVVTADIRQVELHVAFEGAGWGLKLGPQPQVESHQEGDDVELLARLNQAVVVGVNNRRMSIDVRMPRNADLELETGNGSVELSSLNGRVTVHTGDGGIHASQLAGTIDLRSGDGGITADALQGDLRLSTRDGRVRATHLSGHCEAGSGDGGIEVDGRFDHLDLHTGDGTVTARVQQGSQIGSASWSVRTGDGSVRLSLPADFRADLDASTGDGHVRSQLPVQGESSRRMIRGTLNGGGPPLIIHTGDGSIELLAL